MNQAVELIETSTKLVENAGDEIKQLVETVLDKLLKSSAYWIFYFKISHPPLSFVKPIVPMFMNLRIVCMFFLMS